MTFIAIAIWAAVWCASLLLMYWIGRVDGLKQAERILDDRTDEWWEAFVTEERKRLGMERD
jgi:hypothetical protein